MSDRAARKRAELRAKLAGLEDEFADWRRVSSLGAPLEKNNSQIRALLEALAVPVETLRHRIEDETDDLSATWARAERMLLSCHEIWDFFRQKFCLRRVDFFLPYLTLADEFAWACYRPAQKLGAGDHNVDPDDVREPPLAFLTEVSTPYALPRGSSYAREVGSAIPANDAFRQIVDRLPVPVVGVPWFQLRHLPDALLVGHEVGHLVETDLRLTATLEAVLGDALAAVGASSEHRRLWYGWLGEVFADLYGVLCTGPAFGHALVDFAATGPIAFRGSPTYPPLWLRVRLVAEAMVRADASDHRDGLLAHWDTQYAGGPPGDGDPVLASEAVAVAAALLTGPYPQFRDGPLTSVLDYPSWYRAAEQTATALLRGSRLSPGIDIRCLLAAAGIAFSRAPERYLAQDATRAVLRHAREIGTKGVRGAGETPGGSGRHRRAGDELLAALEVAAGTAP